MENHNHSLTYIFNFLALLPLVKPDLKEFETCSEPMSGSQLLLDEKGTITLTYLTLIHDHELKWALYGTQ